MRQPTIIHPAMTDIGHCAYAVTDDGVTLQFKCGSALTQVTLEPGQWWQLVDAVAETIFNKYGAAALEESGAT